jgi:general secretion pathway protein N
MRSHKPHMTNTSAWGWATGGVFTGLAVALLLFAPARWLSHAVQRLSEGRVLLDQPSGTVWRGSAQLRLAGGVGSSDAATLPGRVAWVLRPSFGGASASLDAACCTQEPLQLQATLHWSGLQLALRDSQSHWPAALLAGLGTPWNTIQAEGQVHLHTYNLSVHLAQGQLAMDGRARLEALDISSRLSTLRPMGSYRLALQGGETMTLKLTTLQGSLELAGQGHWASSGWHFEGTASAAPERQDALSNLLNIIGRRDGARSLITIG